MPALYPKIRRKAAPHYIFRYELVKKVGQGTFGQVWQAIDHKSNALVALKEIDLQENMVTSEAIFLRKASSDHVISLLSNFEYSEGSRRRHIFIFPLLDQNLLQ